MFWNISCFESYVSETSFGHLAPFVVPRSRTEPGHPRRVELGLEVGLFMAGSRTAPCGTPFNSICLEEMAFPRRTCNVCSARTGITGCMWKGDCGCFIFVIDRFYSDVTGLIIMNDSKQKYRNISMIDVAIIGRTILLIPVRIHRECFDRMLIFKSKN